MLTPSSVSVGITALRATCETSTRDSPRPFARRFATKSASSTSIMPTRSERTRIGTIAIAAVNPGRISASTCSQNVVPQPPTGSSSRRSAKISISTMPNQNAGSPRPATETPRTT